MAGKLFYFYPQKTIKVLSPQMKKVKTERKFVNSHENKENISLTGLGNTLSQPSFQQIFVELTLRKRQEMCLYRS